MDISKKKKFTFYLVYLLPGLLILTLGYFWAFDPMELKSENLFTSIFTLSIFGVVLYYILLNNENKYIYKNTEYFLAFPYPPKIVAIEELKYIITKKRQYLYFTLANTLILFGFFHHDLGIGIAFIFLSIINHLLVLIACVFLKYRFTQKYFDGLYLLGFLILSFVDIYYISFSESIENYLYFFPFTVITFAPLFLSSFNLLISILITVITSLILLSLYKSANYYFV